jgi:hypothetical protein
LHGSSEKESQGEEGGDRSHLDYLLDTDPASIARDLAEALKFSLSVVDDNRLGRAEGRVPILVETRRDVSSGGASFV